MQFINFSWVWFIYLAAAGVDEVMLPEISGWLCCGLSWQKLSLEDWQTGSQLQAIKKPISPRSKGATNRSQIAGHCLLSQDKLLFAVLHCNVFLLSKVGTSRLSTINYVSAADRE